MPKAPKAKAFKPLVTQSLHRLRSSSTRPTRESKTCTQSQAQKLIEALKGEFEANAKPTQAISMKMYMRNQFEYYGLKAPEQREISKRVTATFPRPHPDMVREVLALAWQEEKREFQMFAIDYAAKNLGNLTGVSPGHCVASTEFIKSLLTTKSWWDTVDMLASKVIGHFACVYRSSIVPVLDEWICSENMWLRRTALLHQLSYKNTTDQARLFRYCLTCCHEREFFIEKAIGWALRTYFRVNPTEVKAFVKRNEGQLAKLSVREALKHA